MPFEPTVGMSLEVAGTAYRVAEHPVAKGAPYGQQGRKGTVYRLTGSAGERALKVFLPAFREPAQVAVAECIGAYAATSGLTACERTVLTGRRHGALLQQYEELTYAVVMPWIEGPTWAELMSSPGGLTREQSSTLARDLARLLTEMEERGLAHCDLSGANLLLCQGAGPPHVELVDLEEMFAPGLQRPPNAPAGSPGYAHSLAHTGLWSREADRFAGAVLLGEILCWCDPRIRQAAWGESYFDPREMQQDCERSRLLASALRELWGERHARLFDRAWQADVLRECPTFGEWSVALAVGPAADEGAGACEGGAEAAESGGEAVETERLFDDGKAALQRREYAKARELLAEVVRRDPAYQRNGQSAATLLAEAGRHGPQAAPRTATPPAAATRAEAPRPAGGPPAVPEAAAPGALRGLSGLTRSLERFARRPVPVVPVPDPAVQPVYDPKQLVAALRAHEVRLTQVQRSQGSEQGVAVATLRDAVRHLRERIEYSFPPVKTLQASSRYGDFAGQVDLFCQDLAAILGGTFDSVRVTEAKYLADALRAESEAVVHSLRKG